MQASPASRRRRSFLPRAVGLESRELLAAPAALVLPAARVAIAAERRPIVSIAAGPVHVHPTVRRQYTIRGTTAEALLAQIERKGPIDDLTNNGRFTTKIRWKIRATYQPRVVGGKLGLRTVRVDETSFTVFPHWANKSSAPAPLQRRWDGYIKALTRHAGVHLKNGRDAAAEIAQKARQLKPANTVEQFEARFNRLVDKVIEKYREKGLSFDRRTRHGETLGAVL